MPKFKFFKRRESLPNHNPSKISVDRDKSIKCSGQKDCSCWRCRKSLKLRQITYLPDSKRYSSRNIPILGSDSSSEFEVKNSSSRTHVIKDEKSASSGMQKIYLYIIL